MPDSATVSNSDPVVTDTVSRKKVALLVLIYALFSVSWIWLSDQLLYRLFSDPVQLALISMLKGFVYVAFSSLLLFGFMQRCFVGKRQANPIQNQSRRRLLTFAILVGFILALICGSLTLTIEQHKQEEFRRLQTLADLKTRQITDWISERRDDAAFIQTSEFFLELYQRWQAAGDQTSGVRLQMRLEQFRKSHGIWAVSLLNPQGEPVWHSEKHATLEAGVVQGAIIASESGQIYMSNPYSDSAGNTLLAFVVPLIAEPGLAPVVIVHIDLSEWLFPVLANWSMGSDSGETLLVRRDGDDILYLSPLRFRADGSSSFNTDQLLAAKAIANPASPPGILEGKDYRNARVIGLVQAISGTDWWLLTKLDKAEIYNKAQKELIWTLGLGVLTLFLVGTGFYLFRQRQDLTMARAVQDAQAERLRALNMLEVISELSTDAIYAKDLEGRYILFNTAASYFVGKPAAEVLGQDDHAIFPPEQANYLRRLGEQVMTQNMTLTFEETLDTPHGLKVFLTTKGPLRDAKGKVTGSFGIARDITERKQTETDLQDSEARFRALVEQSLAGIYIIQAGRFVYVNPKFAEIFGYESADDITRGMSLTDLVAPQDRPKVLENVRRRVEDEIEDLQYRFSGLRRDGVLVHVEVHGRRFDFQQQPAIIGFLVDVSMRKAYEDKLSSQAAELQARNDELERFNRAMVGRELDMIALKQNINELSRQLGREPPHNLAFIDQAPSAT